MFNAMRGLVHAGLLVLAGAGGLAWSADAPAYNDPAPKKYDLTARASKLDPSAKEHPELSFVFEKDGKPQDVQHAVVDTRVAPRGQLVIWLMGYSGPLFDRTSSYGLHSIQVHYANGWFGALGKNSPGDGQYLGRIRLEATTGEDASPDVNIPKADGMKERAFQFVKWLVKEHPQGKWEQFLNADKSGLEWEKVIICGASHGATSAARFALHQKVARCVMFCGPRDQLEIWQGLPSATPKNRFFGFSHVLDGGWSGDHYCRSWQLLGLQEFGPVTNVDKAAAPYGNTRRLITSFDVKNDAKRAHGIISPGSSSAKGPDGKFLYEPVWKYLFTHPVDDVGQPVPADPDCKMVLKE